MRTSSSPGHSPPDSPPDNGPASSPDGPLQDKLQQLYSARAARYDLELAPFATLRDEAIAALQLQPGRTVLDLGCGTGLSLPALRQAVGSRGRVIGVELCPAMLVRAQQRVAEAGWRNVELQLASAEQTVLKRTADAALFFFTHDLLQQASALPALLARALKPGARVVAVGLCWAPPWQPWSNAFVLGAALYSVASLDGLAQPWRHLAAALRVSQLERRCLDAAYLLQGCR
ncbi:methyltransferase domain-containing protein [Paucibacter sp. APW11]|uniref:Methyltransferase domain-containing protein n=2 Tax=Roseateles aquae TaxID=3077235 RepID=A0ABU3PIP8_9BURK|nr:methyltransferase domain-containing protein [Paucibacter sp. APW11]